MKKIPALFVRNHELRHAPYLDQVTPGCEWVTAGEGVATRKFDGTAVMIRRGQLFKRYDAKGGKAPPRGFEPCQEPDPVTTHWPGWIPCTEEPASWPQCLAHANARSRGMDLRDGTYEALGPSINGNPEGAPFHDLVRHGVDHLDPCPRTFVELRAWLSRVDIEGVVFHHVNGRMVKVTKQGFGLPRKP